MFVQKIMPRKMRGFTLTEAAIVLGIMGLILGAIWVAAASVYENMRVKTTSEQILTIVQKVRSMNATQQGLGETGDITPNMRLAGMFPNDMVDPSNNVKNRWDGDVTIYGGTQAGSGVVGDVFGLSYDGLPQDSCIDLAVRMTGPARDGGLIDVTSAKAAATTRGTLPLTISTAAAVCSATTDTNVLTFTFRVKS